MAKPAFDPNQAFEPVNLAQNSGAQPEQSLQQKPAFDPGQAFEPAQEPQEQGPGLAEKGAAFTQGFGESATFGYLPEIQAAVYPAVEKVGEWVTGKDLPDDTYQERKQGFEQMGEQTKAKAPVSAMGGQIAGFIAPGAGVGKIAQGGVKALKLAPKAAKMMALALPAIEGGLMGGVQKAEDLETKLKNVGYGALTGGVMTGAGKGMEKMGGFLKEHSKALRIKGVGTMLKDFRKIYERGEVNKLNNFIKNKKILRPGDSVESVVEKTKPLIKKYGKELDEVYTSVKNKLDDGDFLDNLTPAQQEKYFEVGFYPGSSKDEALSYIKSKIASEEGASSALNKVSGYLDEQLANLGDDITIKQANELKSAIDRTINYSRNPMTKDPVKEQAFYHLRSFVNKKIKDQVKFVDDTIGGELAQKLGKLNSDYGSAAKILDISSDRVARDASNRIFGLSEQLATGALGAGSLAGGQDKETAALMAGLGFLASKGAKKYGPGVGAPLMSMAGKAFSGAGKATQAIAKPAAALVADRAKPKKPKFKPPVRGPGIKKGPREKWAMQGYDKAFGQSNGALKDKLMSDPKKQRMLVEISKLKKGSRAYNDLKSKIMKGES